MRSLTIGFLLCIPAWASAQDLVYPELTREEQAKFAEVRKLRKDGLSLIQSGRPDEAVVLYQRSLEMVRKLFPESRHPDGHIEVAVGLSTLGTALSHAKSLDKALACHEQSMAIIQKLYPAAKFPDGHPQLASSFIGKGLVLQKMELVQEALSYFERALAIYQKHFPASKYPGGVLDVARTLRTVCDLYEELGQLDKALSYAVLALAEFRKLYPTSAYPNGHEAITTSIYRVGTLLRITGAYEEAVSQFDEVLAMLRAMYPTAKYPDGNIGLTRVLNQMGLLRNDMGDYERALAYLEQALAMAQALYPSSKYPDGHRYIGDCLNNLGHVYQKMGLHDKAKPYLESALSMSRKLYPASRFPDGHSFVALGLSNLSDLHFARGSNEEAILRARESLEMYQKLYPALKYPDGHRELTVCLNKLGMLLYSTGPGEQALPYIEQALTMREKLYPSSRYPAGHALVATSLANMGLVLQATGSDDKAMPYVERALAMRHSLGRQVLATASEAEGLAFAYAQPLDLDAYLSITALRPDTAAAAYEAVWRSKSAVSRVLERRHAAARVADTEHAVRLESLKELRRRIDQLLQDRRLSPADRDKLLTEAATDRDRLERDLAKALPMLQRAEELSELGPAALVPLLPDGAVLIDFVFYTRFDFDRSKPGRAGEIRTPSYAAFVVARGTPFRRIELGPAKPLDGAVSAWRQAIEERTDSLAAHKLRDLVWAKVAPHLPAGTVTLYLSPDGGLTRLPWAALPISAARVLLEDYTPAIVPHGPFLLEAVKYPRKYPGPDTTLLLGGVAYNASAWRTLPGTQVEVAALAPLAPRPPTALTGTDATPNRLAHLLPKARYAHLATHGYFDADALGAEKKRGAEALKSRPFGDDSRQVAGKNPLAFTGLVLTGGEVFTGLKLVDLSLANLKLVTLSACETGLGEYTGGEGVQGLQRAFHLAGCPNVVASLWKVNDDATAALMTKFYHEMWINKKSPIEALREAQLTIYRRPDLIATLASAERGLKLESALNDKERPEAAGTTPTKLWAAFVLSGVGK